MRPVDRAQWLARFDMEHLVGAILQNGMLVSMALIAAGVIGRWLAHDRIAWDPSLQAKSLPLLVWADLQRLDTPAAWPLLLVHLGIATLMLTPYLRVVASLIYFILVERSWKHAMFTGVVLALLTITLLTTFV